MGPKAKRSSDAKEDSNSPVKKAKKPQTPQERIVRDEVSPMDLSALKGAFVKIISWNVAGLRGIVRNRPNVLKEFVKVHKPDILCLQEHKLQEKDVKDWKDHLVEYGYASYWACSTTKLGYSGVAIFVRDPNYKPATAPKSAQQKVTSFFTFTKPKRMPEPEPSAEPEPAANPSSCSSPSSGSVTMSLKDVVVELPHRAHCGEGRTITMEFPSFFFVGAYVPNSGNKLQRLDYRVDEWDVYMREYLKGLEAKGKPVVYAGDLNVGHLDLDIYNATAKHIVKVSGLTPRERESHTDLLSAGFVDAFRWLYPSARGQFTFWNQIRGSREPNRGIRLDYFLCSESIMPKPEDVDQKFETLADDAPATPAPRRKVIAQVASAVGPVVIDSYILHDDETTKLSSDHCPVVLILDIFN